MRKGFRGLLFHSVSDPWALSGAEHESAEFFPDGLLVTEDGKVEAMGDFNDLQSHYPNLDIQDLSGRLIIPGFIDGHIHFPQVRVLGSYGEELLAWLQKWVFPEEAKYRDPEYAALGAKEFFDDLLSAGTTTCQVFTTASPTSTEALFKEALARNVRVISGLTGMDRLAPPDACISPEDFLKESSRLIEKYHGKGRLLYAITPRYALGSTRELLEACGELKRRYPDCWVNTHLSETLQECSEVAKAFPDFPDYLAVYEGFGLVGEKFTGGHGIWLSDSELSRLHETGSALSFCPCSNLFLGSGLFQLGRITDPARRVRFSVGSDIGGGNRFCMLPVLDEAYKVGMLNYTQILFDHPEDPEKLAEAQRNRLSPYKALYASTLGGAESMRIDHLVGNFEPGKDADFVVLDWNGGQRALRWRQSLKIDGSSPADIHEAADLLFGLIAAGDDRAIKATYLMANCAWQR